MSSAASSAFAVREPTPSTSAMMASPAYAFRMRRVGSSCVVFAKANLAFPNAMSSATSVWTAAWHRRLEADADARTLPLGYLVEVNL